MSRTLKDEFKSDGFHVGNRLARQARPSGHRTAAFVADLLLDEEEVAPVPTRAERPAAARTIAIEAAATVMDGYFVREHDHDTWLELI